MCEASIWTWSIRSSSVIIIFLLCFLIVTGPSPGLPVVFTVVGNFSSFSSCCGGGDGSATERGGILKSLKSNQDWKFPSSKAMESEDSSRNKITKQNRTFAWTKKQFNFPVLMCLTCIFTLTSETIVLYACQHQLSITGIRPNFIARDFLLLLVPVFTTSNTSMGNIYQTDKKKKLIAINLNDSSNTHFRVNISIFANQIRISTFITLSSDWHSGGLKVSSPSVHPRFCPVCFQMKIFIIEWKLRITIEWKIPPHSCPVHYCFKSEYTLCYVWIINTIYLR